jgi:hypothetical protein
MDNECSCYCKVAEGYLPELEPMISLKEGLTDETGGVFECWIACRYCRIPRSAGDTRGKPLTMKISFHRTDRQTSSM